MTGAANDKTAMQERLQQLGAQFLLRTRGEIASLKESLQRVRAGDTAALLDLERLAHKIHGTGATLGFDGVSAHAEAIERFAERRDGAAIDASSCDHIAESIAKLGSEVDSVAAAQGLK